MEGLFVESGSIVIIWTSDINGLNKPAVGSIARFDRESTTVVLFVAERLDNDGIEVVVYWNGDIQPITRKR